MKKQKEELKTEHLPGWKTEAIRLGWDPSEIKSLQTLLMPTTRVVKVTMHKILLLQFTQYTFGGTGHDGKYTESTVQRSGYSVWHNYKMPETKTAKTNEWAECWCPAHGIECSPTADGCGYMQRRVSLEVCACPTRPWNRNSSRTNITPLHDAGCPVLQRENADRIDEDVQRRLAAEEQGDEEPVMPESKPVMPETMVMTTMKQKRRKGEPLEGQLPMKLG